MRILFSILLLTTFVLRPLIEMSTIMYYQLNIDEIVEKYCINKDRPRLHCNGKCYLMSQMKANSLSSEKESDTIMLSELFIPLFYQENSFELTNVYTNFNIQHHWKTFDLKRLEISKDIDYPPQRIFS